MVKKVLLCPPKYYQIEYEINPWMDIKNKVDKKKVEEEFEKLKDIYKKVGLEVLILDAQAGLPDMVYTANCGFVIDDLFIKANFRYKQRRKEADFAEVFFQKKNFKVGRLPEEVFFEGQGDMFYRDGNFFMGSGKRTSPEAKKYIDKIIGQESIKIEVNDPYYYHLDTCFAPLGYGKVIIKTDSFKKEDVDQIKKNFNQVIEVSAKDNPFMCCNIVCTDEVVIAGEGIGKDIKKALNDSGFEVVETPMSEYFKGGGSVKCLTLELFES